MPPFELLVAVRMGAGRDGAGGIFEVEVRVTVPPSQIVLIEALADTVGAVWMITEVEFVEVQLFVSVIIKV